MKKWIIVLVICWINVGGIQAQFGQKLSVEGNFHLGKIVKHTPKLLYDPPAWSQGMEITMQVQTQGDKDWHHWQNFPRFGLSFLYYNLGEREILGRSYSLFPHLTLSLYRSKKFETTFQVGTGFAYLDRFFSRIDNTTNNAIGSNLNNITHVKFLASYQSSPQLKWQAGFSFTHFSNGAAQLPNFGINIPGLMVGLHYQPRLLDRTQHQAPEVSKRAVDKRLGLSVHLGVAFKEIESVGGPRYPIYNATISGLYSINRVNRFSIGMEYEYNRAAYAFGQHVLEFNSEAEARRRSARYMVFIGDEFLFGSLGITLQAGYYVSKNSYLTTYPIYTKLITRYYFPAIGRPKGRAFVGVTLKSHLAIAEYIAFGGGVVF